MGVVNFGHSFTSSVPAPKLFEALIVDPDAYVPKAVPQFVKSYEIIQGSGGPGSIRQVNFPEGGQIKYAKHKIDVLDKENLIYADTVIEGAILSDKIESITHEAKFESSPDGGCVNNIVIKFYIKDGAELTDEELKPVKDSAHGVFRGVIAYLIANPDA